MPTARERARELPCSSRRSASQWHSCRRARGNPAGQGPPARRDRNTSRSATAQRDPARRSPHHQRLMPCLDYLSLGTVRPPQEPTLTQNPADYALVKEPHVFVPSWRISPSYERPAEAEKQGSFALGRCTADTHLRSELCRTNTPSPPPQPMSGRCSPASSTGTGRPWCASGRALRRVAAPATRCPPPTSPCPASCGRGRAVVAPDGDRRREPGRAARLRVPSTCGDNRLRCCCLGPKALP